MPPAMSQIDDPKIAFAYSRPACVSLTKEPTVTNVEVSSEQSRDIHDASLQQLQDYVLFPLRFVLKVPGQKKEKSVQSVAEAVGYVSERTCVQSWDTLRDLFSELCVCLCSPTDPGKPADTSEESKSAVSRCSDASLHAAYGDIVFRLYEPVMSPGSGAAVSLSSALGEKDKSRDIQAAALKCLQSSISHCDCGQEHIVPSWDERGSSGGAMASFLPGITVAVARIITGDSRQGHAVTVRAIKVWSRTVGSVMDDSQSEGSKSCKTPSPDSGRIGELVVQRTPDWAKATAGKSCVSSKRIISCTSAHQHWRVRSEMVESADHSSATCGQSSKECAGPLSEASVGAINDEEPRVRERCEVALRDVSQKNQSGTSSKNLTDVLSENLHSLATSLPRSMRTSDDQKKSFVLNVFLGYSKVSGPSVSVVSNSAAHSERICKALMQVSESDVMDVRIVEERSSTDPIESSSGSPDSYTAHTQRKHFSYFTDDKIFSVLMEICRTLGYYGNIYLLSDHSLDLYRQSSAYRKQAAMVLNESVRGAAGIAVAAQAKCLGGGDFQSPSASKEDLKATVVSIMEEYTSSNNWHSTTASEETETDHQDQQLSSPFRLRSITSSPYQTPASLQVIPPSSASPPTSSSTSTIHQLNSNIWQSCIQSEGSAGFAEASRRDFRPSSMTSLYPVSEKAGEETSSVSQTASSTMMVIGEACGYSSPKESISDNSDYSSNDISVNLQRLGQHPQAPRVLTVMSAHSDCSSSPSVRDIVQDVSMASDLSYDHTAASFCSVSHALMKASARWFPPSCCRTSKPPSLSPSAKQEDFDICQFSSDYRKQKELAQGIGIEVDETEDPEVPPPPECEEVDDSGGPDVKAELPPHLSIAKDVAERCVHLSSDPSLRLRLKVSDVSESCVYVSSEREDESSPMAHRCWPSSLQRLTADDPLAVLRAFKVSCASGETCGDFSRRRVSKEVLPKSCSSSTRQAPISAAAGPVYSHTSAYKSQSAVSQGSGSSCQRSDSGEADLDAVCEACSPYSSCRQPIRSQEACLSVFRHLIQVDPDSFWFTSNEIHCPSSYTPPHADLQPSQSSGMGRPRDEYSDNVSKSSKEEFDSNSPTNQH